MQDIFLPEPIAFEWDESNREKNWHKHRVLIKECEEVFEDEKRQSWKDILHSKNEPRYIMLGSSQAKRILFVVFTIRNLRVRVVSARDASKRERELYL